MNRQQKLLICFMFLLIVGLTVLRLYLQQGVDTNDEHVYRLTLETERLHGENIVLRQQILIDSALDVISSKAAQMGFVTGKPIFVVGSGKTK